MTGKLLRKKQRDFEDGTTYDGGWEKGVFHGQGTLTWGRLGLGIYEDANRTLWVTCTNTHTRIPVVRYNTAVVSDDVAGLLESKFYSNWSLAL